MLSNIASSPKIIDWVFSLDPIQLSFDAGTLLFPISYVISDVMTEEYGYKRSRQIIWIGFTRSAQHTFSFILVASALGVFPWSLFWSLIITNYIFKVGIETAVTPLTHYVVKALQKAEGVDILDENTSFSPYKFN